MSVVGTAKIVTNEGDGKYTITQTLVDTTDDSFKTGTVGLVGEDAWDANLETTRSAGDLVIFQMVESFDGKKSAVITGPDLGSGQGSHSLRLDKWYFIEADQGWTTIDTRNWGGRWAWIATVSDPGEMTEFFSGFVEHWDATAAGPAPDGAYVSQETNHWFRLMLNSSSAEQNISRVINGVAPNHDGDFFLRMKANGNIEILVENFEAIFSVRFSLKSTAPKPEEETIS